MTRTVIFDPGGQRDVRAGINVTVEPTGYERRNKQPYTGRAAFGRLISGQDSELTEIQMQAMVSIENYRKLQALHNFASQAIDIGQIPEVIMYDLWEPFTELQSQTRAHIPETSVISTPEYSEYWVMRAGIFQMDTITYSNCPVVKITFAESFKITYDMVYGG